MSPSIVQISQLLAKQRNAARPVAAGRFKTYSFADLRQDVSSLGVRISAMRSHKILTITDNPYALAVSVLAIWHAGKCAVLPANLQPGHIAALTEGGCEIVTDLEPYLDSANAIFNDGPSNKDMPLRSFDPDHAELILHTSGSTGEPLAIHKNVRHLEAEIETLEQVFAPPADCRVLATVPPYHIYGLLFRVLWPLSAGRVTMTDMISYPEELVAELADVPNALLVSSPAFLKRAIEVLDLDAIRPDLGPVFSSGGPLPPDVAAAFNATLASPIVEVYGSTETGGIGYRSVFEASAVTPWTPFPAIELSIDTDDGALQITSPFFSYDGPFHTADMADIQADGSFLLKGRADRIVKLEEQRISLVELESRLVAEPEVAAARVIEIPARRSGRTILAAIIVPTTLGWQSLAASSKPAMNKILAAKLHPFLGPVATPRRWRYIKRLPEDNRGKTSLLALKNLFLPDLGRNITPVILKEEVEGEGRLDIRLPANLSYFDGHFENTPILPGVVQIDWAINKAREYQSIPQPFLRIEALKFFQILQAGQDVTLSLKYNADKLSLQFEYLGVDKKYSSGRIVFSD